MHIYIELARKLDLNIAFLSMEALLLPHTEIGNRNLIWVLYCKLSQFKGLYIVLDYKDHVLAHNRQCKKKALAPLIIAPCSIANFRQT